MQGFIPARISEKSGILASVKPKIKLQKRRSKMKDEKLERLAGFLSYERDRQVQILAKYNQLVPKEQKKSYTDTQVHYMQLYSFTLSKIRTYSEILDVINELGE